MWYLLGICGRSWSGFFYDVGRLGIIRLVLARASRGVVVEESYEQMIVNEQLLKELCRLEG